MDQTTVTTTYPITTTTIVQPTATTRTSPYWFHTSRDEEKDLKWHATTREYRFISEGQTL